MKERSWIFAIILAHVGFLLYGMENLSINYYEAEIFFDKLTPLHFLVATSCKIFGQNDFGLRFPFILINIINVLLLYGVSRPLLKNSVDRILNIAIFVLLPGTNTAALIVNEAGLSILVTLLFVYLWQRKRCFFAYTLLVLSLGIDNSFAILYFCLAFYGVFKKRKTLFILSVVLFCASMYIYGFEAHGKPKGYFLETIGIYAATLSPFIFLYYVYTLYRVAIKEKKSLLWFIGFGAFILSLLFSLRQKLYLEDYLPFAIILTPLMVKVFYNSYRVRLPQFRKIHKALFIVVFLTLVLNFLAIIFNKTLYMFYENPKEHFAYKNHVAKELALWLKEKNIDTIYTKDFKLAKRLRFYGIGRGGDMTLKKVSLKDNGKDLFRLDFFHKPVARYKLMGLHQIK